MVVDELTIGSLTAGTYSNIYVVTSAGCPSNTKGPYTLVDPNPPATPVISAVDSICSGKTLSLTASTTTAGTATYSWTGPNGFTSNIQSPTIPNIVFAGSGDYKVTVTINSCISSQGIKSIRVDSTPVMPVVTATTPICSDSTLLLGSSTTSPGVMSYAWTGPNSFTSTIKNPTISNVTVAATGTYSVVYTSQVGGCISAAGTKVVTVNQTPVITFLDSLNPTNCGSATGYIRLSGLLNNTSYTVKYLKGATPVTVSIVSNGSGELTIGSLTAGTYSNIYVVTVAGCPSNTKGPYTLVDPNPPATPVISAVDSICSGKTLSLTASTTTAGTATYSWTGPNGFTSSVQSPTIPNIVFAGSGDYKVTVTINSCISSQGIKSIRVDSTPVMPVVTATTPICSDSTLLLGSSTTSPGVMSYAWTGPNSFTSTIKNPTISNVTVAATGTYSVVYTSQLGGCISAAGTKVVTVNQTPIIRFLDSLNPTNCGSATGYIRLSGLLNNTSYTVKYLKGATPVTVSIVSNGSGELTIGSLTAGTYNNIYVVTLAGCPSNTKGPYTLVDPNPPATPVISAVDSICSGKTLSLTASTTTAGTATYSWTGPNGFTSSVQSPTIPNIVFAGSGDYKVTVTINSCISSQGIKSIRVDSTPVMPVVTATTPICSDSTLLLGSSTTSPGVMSYAWTGPNSFTSTIKNPTISNVTVAATGTYSVVYTSQVGGCISATGTKAVTVNQTPTITFLDSLNPTNCGSATGYIRLSGLLNNTTYTVHYLKGATPVSGSVTTNGSGQLTIGSLTAGTYSNINVVTAAGCPSNKVGPYSLVDPNPPATPVISAVDSICSGKTLSLTASTATSGTASYSWTGPNGFTSNIQSPTIPNIVFAGSGDYKVTVTINSCISSQGIKSIRVDSTPVMPVVTATTPICSDSTLLLGSSTTSPGVMSYAWTGPNSFTSTIKNPTITNVTVAATGTYSVVYTSQVGGCISATGTKAVTVNQTPTITFLDSLNPTNCASATGYIRLSGLLNNTTYTVHYLKGATPVTVSIASNGSGVLTIGSLTAGTYSNIYVVTVAGCPSNTKGPYTLVDPNPPATPVISAVDSICSGKTLSLTASTTTSGTASYSWTGPNGFTSNIQSPTIPNIVFAGSGDYKVTVTINSCISFTRY